MKNDLKLLTIEVEKKIGKKIHVGSDFDKLSAFFVKHHLLIPSQSLKKVWGYISGKEKPSRETLDKLALFTGFQSWDDFRDALHGDVDGLSNYEVEEKKKGDSAIS